MARKNRPKITWKVQPNKPVVPVVNRPKQIKSIKNKPRLKLKAKFKSNIPKKLSLQPTAYSKEPALDKGFADLLLPGSMFLTIDDCCVFNAEVYGVQPHKYPYIISTPSYLIGTGKSFKAKTLALYMGTTRVDEALGKKTVSVKRHTFLIDSCMILTNNVCVHFTPAAGAI